MAFSCLILAFCKIGFKGLLTLDLGSVPILALFSLCSGARMSFNANGVAEALLTLGLCLVEARRERSKGVSSEKTSSLSLESCIVRSWHIFWRFSGG